MPHSVPLSRIAGSTAPDNPVARTLMFFGLIPALIGFVMGVNQVAIARAMAWPVSILFWVGLTMVLWTGLFVVTSAMGRLLAPWRVATIWVVIAAALTGSIVLRPLIWACVSLFQPFLNDPVSVRPMKPFAFNAAFIVEHLRNWAALIATWTVVNLVSSKLFDFPNYGSEPPNAVISEPTRPLPEKEQARLHIAQERFMLGGGRLRDVGEIAAIHAEDHYVRVFPRDGGDFIVTARFRDAVDVLATIRGCQTHRSWWVNAADVRHVDCHRRDPVIELSTGLTVPVSQSYKQLLRRAGMLPPA